MIKHVFTEPQFSDNGELYAEVECMECGAVAKRYKFSNFFKYKTDSGWSNTPTPCGKPEPEKKSESATGSYRFIVPLDCRKPESVEHTETTRFTKTDTAIKNSQAVEIEKPNTAHVFGRREITNGERVLEMCKCGVVSYRYKDGSRKYVSKLSDSLLSDEPTILNCGVRDESKIVTGIVKSVLEETYEIPKIEKSVIMNISPKTKIERPKRGTSLKGRHKFVRREIPLGENCVTETCACGAVCARYKTGFRTYYDADGKPLKESPSCSIDIKIKEQPKIKKIKIETNDNDIMEKNENKILAVEKFVPDTRLIDAYIIIKMMYEDLVRAGVNSTGRNKAGRLLYSEEFEKFKDEVGVSI